MESTEILKPLSVVELSQLTYVLTILVVVMLFTSIYLLVKLGRINRIYQKMMQGSTGESIEKMILGRVQEIEKLKQSVDNLRMDCGKLETESRGHIQQVGVVRFKAFDNTGSDLSFAVAMMDATQTGFVLSGIYGREESRVYAKPLIKGESTYALTKEERQALDAAIKK